MPTQVANEKWILTVKELHLGHCKETFRAGAVIELDEANGRLIIDGRRFNDTRDLDVLKRQSAKFPNNPWIVPYSKEMRDAIVEAVAPTVVSQTQLKAEQKLMIVESDTDLNEPIDIRNTQVSKVNAAAKLAAKNKVIVNGMEVIRGDESVEDRLASLKGKTDLNSIAERVRLKATGTVKMSVVRDDSLGSAGGSKSVSLNAGQHLPSREEADSRLADKRLEADARKREADIRRRAAGIEEPNEGKGDGSGDSQEASSGVPEASARVQAPVPTGDAALRAENAELKARMERLEKMMIAQAGTAPRRGRKPGRPAKVQAQTQEPAQE